MQLVGRVGFTQPVGMVAFIFHRMYMEVMQINRVRICLVDPVGVLQEVEAAGVQLVREYPIRGPAVKVVRQ